MTKLRLVKDTKPLDSAGPKPPFRGPGRFHYAIAVAAGVVAGLGIAAGIYVAADPVDAERNRIATVVCLEQNVAPLEMQQCVAFVKNRLTYTVVN